MSGNHSCEECYLPWMWCECEDNPTRVKKDGEEGLEAFNELLVSVANKLRGRTDHIIFNGCAGIPCGVINGQVVSVRKPFNPFTGEGAFARDRLIRAIVDKIGWDQFGGAMDLRTKAFKNYPPTSKFFHETIALLCVANEVL